MLHVKENVSNVCVEFHTIVVVLRSVFPMMITRGRCGWRAGGMKTHVREDHPGFLQEDHHNFVPPCAHCPYIGTPLEIWHDDRYLARKWKRSRSAIPRWSVDWRDLIPLRKAFERRKKKIVHFKSEEKHAATFLRRERLSELLRMRNQFARESNGLNYMLLVNTSLIFINRPNRDFDSRSIRKSEFAPEIRSEISNATICARS